MTIFDVDRESENYFLIVYREIKDTLTNDLLY